MQPLSFRPEIKAMIFSPRADSSRYDKLIFHHSWYSPENNVVPPQELRPIQCSSDCSEPACYQTLPTAGFSSILTIPLPVVCPVRSLFSTLSECCFVHSASHSTVLGEMLALKYIKDVAGMLEGWGYIFTTTFFLSEEIH